LFWFVPVWGFAFGAYLWDFWFSWDPFVTASEAFQFGESDLLWHFIIISEHNNILKVYKSLAGIYDLPLVSKISSVHKRVVKVDFRVADNLVEAYLVTV